MVTAGAVHRVQMVAEVALGGLHRGEPAGVFARRRFHPGAEQRDVEMLAAHRLARRGAADATGGDHGHVELSLAAEVRARPRTVQGPNRGLTSTPASRRQARPQEPSPGSRRSGPLRPERAGFRSAGSSSPPRHRGARGSGRPTARSGTATPPSRSRVIPLSSSPTPACRRPASSPAPGGRVPASFSA
jgi:hypothetical protein